MISTNDFHLEMDIDWVPDSKAAPQHRQPMITDARVCVDYTRYTVVYTGLVFVYGALF